MAVASPPFETFDQVRCEHKLSETANPYVYLSLNDSHFFLP